MPSLNEITVSQLMRLIGTPEAPRLIDVSVDADHAADPRLIPGAGRAPKDDLLARVPDLRGTRVVVICQRGGKLSQGGVALLRAEGIDAEYLQGGNVAWRDAGLPLVPVAMIPAPVSGTSLWVTRHRPKIDRIACPWLIRRFVDPKARFLFVAPSVVSQVSDVYGATPFDVEGVYWSHRGETCTFDTMLDGFDLNTEPLRRMATVIRGADTNRHDLAPQAAGLLALSVGLSRQFKDDHQQLEVAMGLYDALYRWARDGFDEGHDWPAARA